MVYTTGTISALLTLTSSEGKEDVGVELRRENARLKAQGALARFRAAAGEEFRVEWS